MHKLGVLEESLGAGRKLRVEIACLGRFFLPTFQFQAIEYVEPLGP